MASPALSRACRITASPAPAALPPWESPRTTICYWPLRTHGFGSAVRPISTPAKVSPPRRPVTHTFSAFLARSISAKVSTLVLIAPALWLRLSARSASTNSTGMPVSFSTKCFSR